MGSFAGVRSATRIRLLGIGSAFRIRFGSVFFRLSRMDFAAASCRRRRRRRLDYGLPLSCANFEFIYHTSLDSLCAGQVKLLLARFNQTVIILRHNLVN